MTRTYGRSGALKATLEEAERLVGGGAEFSDLAAVRRARDEALLQSEPSLYDQREAPRERTEHERRELVHLRRLTATQLTELETEHRQNSARLGPTTADVLLGASSLLVSGCTEPDMQSSANLDNAGTAIATVATIKAANKVTQRA